jgi:cation diffusion facilitator family transporter
MSAPGPPPASAGASRWLEPVPCTVVGMLGNAVLTAGKIAIGLLAQSASLVADGFHSLSDLAGDVGILLTLRASRRPPDADHPYGHHSLETLGALGASLLLAATGVLVGRDAALRLLEDSHLRPRLPALIAVLIAILLKEAMARYTYLSARLHNSPALRANAANHRADVLSSVAAAAGILGALVGLPVLDSVAALLIAALILKMGWDLIRENALTLMDTMPEPELLDGIRRVVGGVAGARGVSELRVRQRGSFYLVDVGIAVDPEHTVAAGHAIAHDVEEALLTEIPSLARVFVHVEPDEAGGAPPAATSRSSPE